jgi:hypothetical protein
VRERQTDRRIKMEIVRKGERGKQEREREREKKLGNK